MFLATGRFLVKSLPSDARWNALAKSSGLSDTRMYSPSPLPQREPPSKQNFPSTTPNRLQVHWQFHTKYSLNYYSDVKVILNIKTIFIFIGKCNEIQNHFQLLPVFEFRTLIAPPRLPHFKFVQCHQEFLKYIFAIWVSTLKNNNANIVTTIVVFSFRKIGLKYSIAFT